MAGHFVFFFFFQVTERTGDVASLAPEGSKCYLEAHGSDKKDPRNASSSYANVHREFDACVGEFRFHEVEIRGGGGGSGSGGGGGDDDDDDATVATRAAESILAAAAESEHDGSANGSVNGDVAAADQDLDIDLDMDGSVVDVDAMLNDTNAKTPTKEGAGLDDTGMGVDDDLDATLADIAVTPAGKGGGVAGAVDESVFNASALDRMAEDEDGDATGFNLLDDDNDVGNASADASHAPTTSTITPVNVSPAKAAPKTPGYLKPTAGSVRSQARYVPDPPSFSCFI